MKRIIFLFGLLVTLISVGVSNEAFAKKSKYKLKLKGAAARAYVRSHNLMGTQSHRTAYYHRHHSGKKVAAHRHASNANKYARHTTSRTHRTAAVTHRRHTTNRVAYHRSRNNGYRGFSASSYSGYRQGSNVRWNKVKIKRSDDKVVYKYKK